MKSPYPPYSEALLQSRPVTEKFKGEDFNVIEVFWYDPVTGQTFDTVETGDATIMQVYNEYRVKHGLPFPDEFATLRSTLGLSAAKMSALLGLGVNQYRLYEKGDIPVDAVGRYVKMLMGNKSALKDCILNAKNILTCNEYQHALHSISGKDDDLPSRMLLQYRSKNNGYAALNVGRMRNVIFHFINRLGPISPTFLNKLLFYTDFLAYRRHGMAISGFSYRALPYGPVPNNWKYIPLVEGVDQQEAEMGTLLTTDMETDYSVFSSLEVNILNVVADRFKSMTASAISELSHHEDAWIQCRSDVTSPISFDHAFTLKAIEVDAK